MKSEFQFIQHIKKRFSLSIVGDDCAVLPKDENSDLLITTDLLVENIDFRLEWAKPADIGHKSLAVSLSDISAMAGTPTFALLSVGVPDDLWEGDFVEEFYSGWHALAKRFGVELVGGDVSSSSKLVIDSIALGEVPKGKAIRRNGAKKGDLIYVSGSLGGASAGLRMLEDHGRSTEGDEYVFSLINKQLRPMPKIDLAKQLLALGIATAMIDISDGLSSDLRHICDASGVGAVIDAESLPIDMAVADLIADKNERLDMALNRGEDFELLTTIAPDAVDLISDLPLTLIGSINDSGRVEIDLKGEILELPPVGYRHF